jgi:hypothetical protein
MSTARLRVSNSLQTRQVDEDSGHRSHRARRDLASYTTREKVLDLGPVEATAERHKTVPLPPIIGGIALAAGIGLLVVGSKKS